MRIAARRGHKRAVTAVARKLAVIMHRMWLDGTEFRFGAENEQPAASPSARPDSARLRVVSASARAVQTSQIAGN